MANQSGWKPQDGPQLDAILARSVPELLFGGARGGGKSDYLLGDYLQDAQQGAAWRGIIIRQSYPELEELMGRAQQVVPQCWPGSEWFKQEKTWHLPTGAQLRMRSLESVEDATHYQGHSYSWIGWDELTAWPDDKAYKMLMATLRSGQGAECMRIRCSANPGGAGHAWVKSRFIDPAPLGYQLVRDQDTGIQRIFIPARVEDNLILMQNDPGYVDRLRGVGTPELVRAWLEGDWNVVQGSYFPEFTEAHIIEPTRIPAGWLRFRALDWGSAAPSCCLWCAISDGETWASKGALVVYKELYTASAPNVGMRLTVEQVARAIKELDLGDEKIAYSVADPAIFAHDGGPSLAERFADQRVYFRPADNRRVGKLGASAGWDLVRQRLIGDDDGLMLGVFATCRNLIRTLPVLQFDPKRPEDLDSSGEDHCADALRYACASRPWVRTAKPAPPALSMDFLWSQREREQQRW